MRFIGSIRLCLSFAGLCLAAATPGFCKDVAASDAERALEATGHNVKLAALVASGLNAVMAQSLLDQNNGHLRPCLHQIAEGQHTNK